MIGKTQTIQPTKPKKQSMAILRLQKDLQSLQSNKIQFAKIEFPDPENILKMLITITLHSQNKTQGQFKTPYNNIRLKFSLEFTENYPIDPPKLRCLQKIYHPNISYSGSVCLPLVREDWSPTVSLEQIIYGLIFILVSPNAQDALEPQIGDQMINDAALFNKIVEYTIGGRTFNQKQYDCILFSKNNTNNNNHSHKLL